MSATPRLTEPRETQGQGPLHVNQPPSPQGGTTHHDLTPPAGFIQANMTGPPAAVASSGGPGDRAIIAHTQTLARWSQAQLAPVTIMAGVHAVSSLLLLPLALAVEGWTPLARAGWAGWGVVLYCAFPVTLGHLWFYQRIRAVGPGRVAVFTNLIPFLVIGLSWAILGEPIRWYHAVGAAVVLGGVVLTTLRERDG